MKKILIHTIFLLIGLNLSAQSNLTLNTVRTSGGTETACQSIVLKPGFSFVSATGKSLTLTVNPSTCDPYAGTVSSLSSNQNYIQTKTYTTDDGSRYMETIQYFDGLGRPTQTVQRGITPNAADLVSLQEYDAFGRESNSWLPAVLTGNNGAYADPASVMAKAKTAATNGGIADTNPFSKPVYEASPLNRVISQYGPGADWHKDYGTNSKKVSTEYLTNSQTTELACKLFKVTGSGTSTGLTQSGTYANGQLYVTKITDEDSNVSYEFKDKLGQVVLTRQASMIGNHDTYYVYDDFGNLSYVLPPMAVDTISKAGVKGELIELWGYLYKYDGRNRCVIKKLPGTDRIYYVYDKADRLIFTQDGEQRKKNEWTFTIPDDFGRVVLTGTCTTVNNAAIRSGRFDDYLIKAEFSTTGTYHGYNVKVGQSTFNELTIQNPVVHTASYYDSYKFRALSGFSADNISYKTSGEPAIYHTRYGTDASTYEHKGLLTGTATLLLDGSTATKYLYTGMYYDNKKQLIQSHSTHHLGGVDSEFTAYNFTGQPVNRKTRHTMGTATQIEHYTYLYDHAGRLVETKHKLNSGAEVVLARNEYDELGRLKATTKSGKANLKTTYAYNIRSWTKSISGPLFSQTLYYNDKVTAHNYSDYTPAYNGNISGMEWKAETEAMRSYRFKYDKLSRLSHAAYNGVVSGGYYNVSYSYDKHGNMQTLHRRGKMTAGNNAEDYNSVDNLTMTYTGNQLVNVRDRGVNVSLAGSADFKDHSGAQGVYTYNANGAMNKDTHKGITGIQYNSLNLPQSIEIDNPNVKGRTKYMYTATGVKLQVIHETDMNLQAATVMATAPFSTQATDTKTTDYVGNKVYENGTLKRTLIDGGYIEGTTYYFFLTDHLGNNRVVANASGTIIQKNHYYPFGMAFAENTTAGQGLQPYKYNGKELDQMHGLNMYDYSARFYEPSIGRFSTVDPLAEKYYSWSPYNYVYNNPIRFIDPDGRGPGDIIKGFFHGLIGHNPNEYSQSSYLLDTGRWKDYESEDVETGNLDYDIARKAGVIVMDIVEVVASPGGKGTIPAKMGARSAKYGPKVAKALQKVGEKLEGKTEKPTRNERMAAKKDKKKGKKNKRQESSSESTYNQETEHTENARNSTEEKHQNGQSRKKKDKGGERADVRRKRYK